jgi:hypothetical protein
MKPIFPWGGKIRILIFSKVVRPLQVVGRLNQILKQILVLIDERVVE